MRLILTVYDALRTFDRPCTRAELEAVTGMTKDDVWRGLRGLMRRHCLHVVGEPRKRTTFRLLKDAKRPFDLRGVVPKSELTRRRMAAAHRERSARIGIHVLDDHPSNYSPARPPSHGSAPGGARIVRSGLGLVGDSSATTSCALAVFWRKF